MAKTKKVVPEVEVKEEESIAHVYIVGTEDEKGLAFMIASGFCNNGIQTKIFVPSGPKAVELGTSIIIQEADKAPSELFKKFTTPEQYRMSRRSRRALLQAKELHTESRKNIN